MGRQLKDGERVGRARVSMGRASWGLRKRNAERGERWGEVHVRCWAALLDEELDRAFVALLALVESYVRIFGSSS